MPGSPEETTLADDQVSVQIMILTSIRAASKCHNEMFQLKKSPAAAPFGIIMIECCEESVERLSRVVK